MRIALAIFGIFFAFLIIEGALRVAGVLYMTHMRQETIPFGTGVYRVLALGESTTAGFSDTWPQELEWILNERNTGKQFVVVNAGLPGVDTAYILSQLEANLDRYTPDVVITMMGVNDSVLTVRYDDSQQMKLRMAMKNLRILKLYRFLRRVWETPAYVQAVSDLVASLRAHAEYRTLASMGIRIGEMAAEIERNENAKLLGITFFTQGITGEEVAALYQNRGLAVTADDRPYEEITRYHYRKLFEILKSRGIAYVAMQYPLLPVSDLMSYFEGIEDRASVRFVSNVEIFTEALTTKQYDELFVDRFAGNFGHTTKIGSILIAESAASAILAAVGLEQKAPEGI